MVAMTLLGGRARVRLGDHTPGQVVTGWVIATVSVVAVFSLYLWL